MLERARYLLVSELALARNCEEANIEVLLAQTLSRTNLKFPEADELQVLSGSSPLRHSFSGTLPTKPQGPSAIPRDRKRFLCCGNGNGQHQSYRSPQPRPDQQCNGDRQRIESQSGSKKLGINTLMEQYARR